MSIGMNDSSGQSTSTGSSFTGGTMQNPLQQAYQANLWGAGQNLANQGAGQQAGYQGYNQAQEALGGPNVQNAYGTLNRLQNPGVDPLLDVYSRRVGQDFNEQIMPTLRTEGINAGGYGGSRYGIGTGLAGARAQQSIQDFAAQLYGQGQDRSLQAAGAAGGLAGNQAQGYLQNAGFGMGVPWYAQQQFRGLLGEPTYRNLGGYSGTSGQSATDSFGFNFGL